MSKSALSTDFCALSKTFSERVDVVIAMDNALPHMLSSAALESAVIVYENLCGIEV